MIVIVFFFFKQKTAYEMRISDWSSDVCSSDLLDPRDFIADQLGDRFDELAVVGGRQGEGAALATGAAGDRKSVVTGKSVPVRVDLGGCRIIKKKKYT